ncbi:MAG: hypothetical protein QOF51_4228 [Chloroflexota bacterium]|nr:hypothetical protein [Chloroflexota bacterium]
MYTDKTLTCRDCGQPFTFTVGEQEFYAGRGLMNEPGRCPECRAARKNSGGAGGYSGGGYSTGGGGYERQERQMFSATCSSCGKEARVPFQPREDRPVYCSDCFETQRGTASGGGYNRNRY